MISAAGSHRACMPMRVYVRPLALRACVLIFSLFYGFMFFFLHIFRHLLSYFTPPYRLNLLKSHLPPLPPVTAAPCRARTRPSLTGSLLFIFIRSLVFSFSTVRRGTPPGAGGESCAEQIGASVQSSEGSSAFACLCARVLQVPFDHCEARIVRLARGTRRMGRKKTSKVKRLKGQSWIPDDGSSLRKVETATKRAHRTGEFCGVLLRECAPRGIAPSPPRSPR